MLFNNQANVLTNLLHMPVWQDSLAAQSGMVAVGDSVQNTFLKGWLADYPLLRESLIVLGVLIASWLIYVITRHYILRGLSRLVKKTKSSIDDAIIENVIAKRLAYIAPVLVIYYFAYLLPGGEAVIHQVLQSVIGLIILLAIGAFLNQLTIYLQKLPVFRDKPIKSYVQVVKLVLYIMGIIFLIGLLTGSHPMTLLSGLGAMTAVLILVFRDTILSFVASLQITSNDLVRVGDWIESKQYGADGDVIDIALHTIKVQNWDKTITTIPTHKLIDGSFKNWRGMQLSGGRRIKRAIYLDLTTVKFCDDALLAKLRRIQLLSDYIDRKIKELEEYNKKYQVDDSVLVNGRRLTNIGVFRAYIEAYLAHNERLNHQLTSLVRQLPPGPNGIPIEIYVFTKETAWKTYEQIQADIFDHLLAVVPEFDLRVFQNPSGHDISLAAEKALS